jgi:hypothetical protein
MRRAKLKLVKPRRRPKPVPAYILENMDPRDLERWPDGKVPLSVYAGRAYAKIISGMMAEYDAVAKEERKVLAAERKAARVKKRRSRFKVVS